MTASVTGCSTWIRQLTSRKKNSPVSASSTNSTVPRLAYPIERATATAASSSAPAGSRSERRCGRLLDQLLVAALDAAVALAEVDDGAVLIGRDLDLDVAGPRDELLDVKTVVGECRGRLAAGQTDARLELVTVAYGLDPAATSAAGRLDQHRIADSLRRARVRRRRSSPRLRAAPGRRPAGRGSRRELVTRESIASVGGPTNVKPFSRALRASRGLSDKNP